MLIISDHEIGPERVPIPSLLASAAVHQSMVRKGTRLQASLIIESGEPREVHHLAALIGYGATAINPYLMLESIAAMDEIVVGGERLRSEDAVRRAIVGLCAGLLKVLSKMGISTIHSYRGAQIFEAVGIDRRLIDEHFTGTPSRLGGIGVEGLAREALTRHARAWPEAHGLALPEHVEEGLLAADHAKLLPQGGVYRWRRDGELHMWDPQTIASLQRSVRDGDSGLESYEEFSRRVNEENAQHALLRGLLGLRTAAESIPIEEVEPATEIVKRFSTGAMSLGALSREAHETLAIAMNRIGGMSNSGEGGEDPARNTPDENGDQRRSRIRQVASGPVRRRHRLPLPRRPASDQGRPGREAGRGRPASRPQGRRLHREPAALDPGRRADLAAAPPRHLLDRGPEAADLRPARGEPDGDGLGQARRRGRRRHRRRRRRQGRGRPHRDRRPRRRHRAPRRSPRSSRPACPGSSGLAEAQQALLDSELRNRVVLQADGQMRTGRDIVVAALLGADEVGLSTAPLIATGCIMMRVCHLNTCPVGVATQDPELRAPLPGHAGAGRHLHALRRRGGAPADGRARHPALRGPGRPDPPPRPDAWAEKLEDGGARPAAAARGAADRRGPAEGLRRSRRPRAGGPELRRPAAAQALPGQPRHRPQPRRCGSDPRW